MIHGAIYSLLKDNAGVKALVGTRVEPLIVPPKSDFPVVTYTIAGGWEKQTLDGTVAKESMVQIDTWSDDYDEAERTMSAVQSCLSSLRTTVGSIRIMRSVMSRRESVFDSTAAGIFHISADFLFTHT